MDDQVVHLDDFYALRIHREGKRGVNGEIIRLNTNSIHPPTHLFNTPSFEDAEALKEWAARALQAYREG
ncbi:hypothetical protein GCM10023310_48400 [Paenibacillus vulneris]|uniref:Uncharacterized protein n=1 Tax=Paenibacillus vulneris TaxID=1133364 RepID=A0ABW3UDW5_9BACL